MIGYKGGAVQSIYTRNEKVKIKISLNGREIKWVSELSRVPCIKKKHSSLEMLICSDNTKRLNMIVFKSAAKG